MKLAPAEEYQVVSLMLEKKAVQFQVHRLVARCWIGPKPKDKPLVLHKSNKKDENGFLNNHYLNLYYGDSDDNMKDRIKDGTSSRGGSNGMSKIESDEVALEIYQRAISGELGWKLAEEFNVGPCVISDIKLKKTWKHIHAVVQPTSASAPAEQPAATGASGEPNPQ